jgi:hypothetical protein
MPKYFRLLIWRERQQHVIRRVLGERGACLDHHYHQQDARHKPPPHIAFLALSRWLRTFSSHRAKGFSVAR